MSMVSMGVEAIDAIRRGLRAELSVTSELIMQQGTTINVGEDFTLRFTIRNGCGVEFNGVWVQIAPTEFAQPYAGQAPTSNLVYKSLDGTLSPWGQRVFTHRFRAVKALDESPWGGGIGGIGSSMFDTEEWVTRLEVHANANPNSMFNAIASGGAWTRIDIHERVLTCPTCGREWPVEVGYSNCPYDGTELE